MANHQGEGPVAMKVSRPTTMTEKRISVNFHRKVPLTQTVNSMDLDEMLEASKMIEMGIKGEKIPEVKSPKAQRYAKRVLQLNRKSDTKPMAEKMMHDLNVRIIKVNKQTTDAVESKRLYRELMAEK